MLDRRNWRPFRSGVAHRLKPWKKRQKEESGRFGSTLLARLNLQQKGENRKFIKTGVVGPRRHGFKPIRDREINGRMSDPATGNPITPLTPLTPNRENSADQPDAHAPRRADATPIASSSIPATAVDVHGGPRFSSKPEGPLVTSEWMTVEELRQKLLENELLTTKEWDEAIVTPADRDSLFSVLQKLESTYRLRDYSPDRTVPLLTEFQVREIVENRIDNLRFGDYVLLEKVGKGGMGVVYKALHHNLRRIDAIKTIQTQVALGSQGDDARRRFQREARILASLRHPAITAVYNAGYRDNTAFIAMEFIGGQSMKKCIEDAYDNGRMLQIPWIVDQTIVIAEALKCAHAHGIIHRDIKPQNLMVDDDGEIKVLDMGIARLFQPEGARTLEVEALTRDSIGLGTPQFMPPEQWVDSRTVTPASDIYSLGCTLYYMLTGCLPYDAPSPSDYIRAHLQDPIPQARALRPEVPKELDMIITKMLAKQKEERYQTAADLISALRKLQRQASQTQIKPFTRPVVWISGLAILGCVAAGFMWVYSQNGAHSGNGAVSENGQSDFQREHGQNLESIRGKPDSSGDSKTVVAAPNIKSVAPVETMETNKTTATPHATPISARQILEQGIAARERGDTVAALRLFQKIMLLDPAILESLTHVEDRDLVARLVAADAEIAEKKQRYDVAVTGYKRAAELAPARQRDYHARAAEVLLLWSIVLAGQQDDAVIAHLTEVMRIDPRREPEAALHRALALQRLGKTSAAEEDWTRAVKGARPAIVEELPRLAQIASAAGRDGEAADLYRRAGELLAGQNARRAISHYSQALEITRRDLPVENPPPILAAKTAALHFARGDLLHKEGENERALADFSASIALVDNVAIYYGRRGEVLSGNRKHAEATNDFLRAAELSQREPVKSAAYRAEAALSRYREGLVELNQRSAFDKAIVCFTEAMAWDESIRPMVRESLAQAHAGKAWGLFKDGDFAAAIATYQSAIALETMNKALYQQLLAGVHSNRADRQHEQGDFEQAINDMRAAAKLDPDKRSLYLMQAGVIAADKGNSLASRGEHREAIAAFDLAKQWNPRNLESYDRRAAISCEKMGIRAANNKEYDEAIEHYSEALRRNPRSGSAYRNRAFVKQSQNEFLDAIADLTDAIRIRENDTEALERRGWIYTEKLGQHAEAVKDYKLLARYLPRDPQVHLRLTAVLIKGKPNKENATLAVQHATIANELTMFAHSDYLLGLAYAHQTAGHGTEAIRWSKKSLEAARTPEQKKAATDALEFFRSLPGEKESSP